MQRRLAWSLRKDDTHKSKSVNNCLSMLTAWWFSTQCRILRGGGRELSIRELIAHIRMKPPTPQASAVSLLTARNQKSGCVTAVAHLTAVPDRGRRQLHSATRGGIPQTTARLEQLDGVGNCEPIFFVLGNNEEWVSCSYCPLGAGGEVH